MPNRSQQSVSRDPPNILLTINLHLSRRLVNIGSWRRSSDRLAGSPSDSVPQRMLGLEIADNGEESVRHLNAIASSTSNRRAVGSFSIRSSSARRAFANSIANSPIPALILSPDLIFV